jgi:hypothetical protein
MQVRVQDTWNPPEVEAGRCTEPELLQPVAECMPDGRLNREAIGWSRQPLHRCNLRRHWLRKKRWNYWCVTTDEFLFSITVADLDYIGLAAAGFLEFGEPLAVEQTAIVPFARRFHLPETVRGGDVVIERRGVRLALTEEPAGTRLQADFRTRAGMSLSADLLVERPNDVETMNVVIPWSATRFQFTSKQTCLPARGTVRLNRRAYPFGPSNHAFGCLDFGRGVWPYRCVWNWAAASGVQQGHRLGITLGGKWTDGTGMTENALCVDGRLSKLSEELIFEYDRSDFMKPWRIRTPVSERIDLTLTPFYERASTVNLLLLGSTLHCMFGRFSGGVISDDGEYIAVRDLIGWAEEHRARW